MRGRSRRRGQLQSNTPTRRIMIASNLERPHAGPHPGAVAQTHSWAGWTEMLPKVDFEAADDSS